MPNKNTDYTPQSKEPKKTYSGSNPQTKGLKYYEKCLNMLYKKVYILISRNYFL